MVKLGNGHARVANGLPPRYFSLVCYFQIFLTTPTLPCLFLHLFDMMSFGQSVTLGDNPNLSIGKHCAFPAISISPSTALNVQVFLFSNMITKYAQIPLNLMVYLSPSPHSSVLLKSFTYLQPSFSLVAAICTWKGTTGFLLCFVNIWFREMLWLFFIISQEDRIFLKVSLLVMMTNNSFHVPDSSEKYFSWFIDILEAGCTLLVYTLLYFSWDSLTAVKWLLITDC